MTCLNVVKMFLLMPFPCIVFCIDTNFNAFKYTVKSFYFRRHKISWFSKKKPQQTSGTFLLISRYFELLHKYAIFVDAFKNLWFGWRTNSTKISASLNIKVSRRVSFIMPNEVRILCLNVKLSVKLSKEYTRKRIKVSLETCLYLSLCLSKMQIKRMKHIEHDSYNFKF